MIFSKLKSSFSFLKNEKCPSRKQWKRFFKTPLRFLKGRERIIFLLLVLLFLTSSLYLVFDFYCKKTQIQPAQGGIYTEGVLGQPRFINPIYAKVSDIDQDLVRLIFSGLFKYDGQGNIVPDLAKNYEIKEGEKVYEVSLKENLAWSDGSPLTADDIVFTIKTIQNSDYKSPLLASWLGVEVRKISESKVSFTLKNPYAPFLENLTQEIIPEKLWKDIPPENFPLAIYNLKPLGSGPYKLKGLKYDKQGRIISLDLVRNPKYQGKTPYISQVSFKLFDFNQEKELIKSYKKGQIQGFSLMSPALLKENSLKNLAEYSLLLPRYFAVFFNTEKSKILTDQNIRRALNYGTNKAEIVEKVLLGHGKIADSPILPEIYGFNSPSKVYGFEPETAKKILQESGFTETSEGPRVKTVEKLPAWQLKSDLKENSRGIEVENLQKCLSKFPEIYPEAEITGFFGSQTKKAVVAFQEKYAEDILLPWGYKEGTGLVSKTTRGKLNELCFPAVNDSLPLKFSLTTVNQPVLRAVAELLKQQWKAIGVEIEIKTFDVSQPEKEAIIKQRNYESLLLGEVLTAIPDPFPFWYSTQKNDPGLNLALYKNKEADKLLEEIRQTLDENERSKKMEKFQNILIQETPAVFLYTPNYLYFVSQDVKGINSKIISEPSQRFNGIEEWYIKTKRVL